MIFKDRTQAGEQLVPLLEKYKENKEVVVLGLPRGGVVTAFALAKGLKLPLDVICLKKIGAPSQPELALGAISASGETYFNDSLLSSLDIPKNYLDQVTAEARKKAEQKEHLYRKSHPAINLKDKIVILVDDGLATGATMHAAIQTVRAAEASSIIVAVPVAAPDSLESIREEADEVICCDTPFLFAAVGQFYDDFTGVEDDEVISLLRQSKS